MVKKRTLLVGGSLLSLTLLALAGLVVGLSVLYIADGTGGGAATTTTTASTTTSSTSSTSTTDSSTTTTTTSSSTTTVTHTTTTSTTSPRVILPDYTKDASVPKIERNLVPDSCYTTYVDTK